MNYVVYIIFQSRVNGKQINFKGYTTTEMKYPGIHQAALHINIFEQSSYLLFSLNLINIVLC